MTPQRQAAERVLTAAPRSCAYPSGWEARAIVEDDVDGIWGAGYVRRERAAFPPPGTQLRLRWRAA